MGKQNDTDLKSSSDRIYYENCLGKTLRKYQWDNLVLEIKGAYPDLENKVVPREILKVIAEKKKKLPKWKVDAETLVKLETFLKKFNEFTMSGIDLFRELKNLCNYPVNNRTIYNWFSLEKLSYDDRKQYSREQCINLVTRAILSKPRSFLKKENHV